MFCKRKREKRKPFYQRLAFKRQKGNGINKSLQVWEYLFYAVVFLATLIRSKKYSRYFCFRICHCSYKTELQILRAFSSKKWKEKFIRYSKEKINSRTTVERSVATMLIACTKAGQQKII